MLRLILASALVSSAIGCAGPIVSEDEPSAPSAPASEASDPGRAAPIELSRCGGEQLAQVAAPSTIRDLTVAGNRLAWIGDASTGAPAVHFLDLTTHRVELHNDPAVHLAAHNGDVAWATASRIAYGTSALTPAGDVDALTLDATHLTYVERINPDYARLIRRDRSTLAAIQLGDGPLSPVVAVDGSNAWFAVSGTSDGGATRTVFRRVSLRGGDLTDSEAVAGKPIKLTANSSAATALVKASYSLLVDMTPNRTSVRTLWQTHDIRDFAAVGTTVYVTEHDRVLKIDTVSGKIERLVSSSCELGAVAATSDAVYFVARDDRSGSLQRYPVR